LSFAEFEEFEFMIRIGVIGAGPNGTGNAASLAKFTDRCRITAVADPVPAAAEKLAAVYGAKSVATPEQLVDDVDAVIISSPNFMHCQHALAMAKAGKHLFIEKPMALTVAEADQIVAAVNAARVASFVGFSVRFGGLVVQMKKMFDAGDLGDLVSIWSRRLCELGVPAGHWRNQFVKSGGVMAELITHEIDFAVHIAGMPNTVYCRKVSRFNDDPRANDHIWLTLGFPSGATCTIEGSQIATVADYYKGMTGAKGGLHTRNWQGELYFGKNQSEAERVELPADIDKHRHFLDVIAGECASAASAQYGRDITLICEKALESAVTGNAIKL
jgi:predicted dehydrogenase